MSLLTTHGDGSPRAPFNPQAARGWGLKGVRMDFCNFFVQVVVRGLRGHPSVKIRIFGELLRGQNPFRKVNFLLPPPSGMISHLSSRATVMRLSEA